MKWKCVYLDASSVSNKKSDSQLLHKPSDPSRRIERQKSEFPATYFLDAELFDQCRLSLPAQNFEIPPEAWSLIGDTSDIRATATDYFDTVHSYLPIISKRLFYQHLLNPLSTPGPDAVLLFLSMKLVMSVPLKAHDATRIPLYKFTKSLHHAVEGSGFPSIHVLQAGILIAFYELSHAIYPAALFSISTCSRYANLFGLDERSLRQRATSRDWLEEEEKRRAWWALVILDR